MSVHSKGPRDRVYVMDDTLTGLPSYTTLLDSTHRDGRDDRPISRPGLADLKR
ncbi:hypothetical protein GCM10009789_87580 [Kribbella sancticallisti]|uniref:Uncharacterized protein n=1 Tax=Kribbella sancticallisti TaxID=460087 RepID=A0ABN2EXZ2_9ACTN